MARNADPEQLTGELIQYGTVATINHGAATCTVDLGDLVTGDLLWLAPRAGNVKIWAPPSEGEQCAVLCPEGDIANGIVLLGLWSDDNPPPSHDPDLVCIQMPDGARIVYNHATHALAVTLPADGTAIVDAPGGTTWNGPVTFNDGITVNGTVAASDDVTAAGVSLKGHKHGSVQAGGAQTGAPV